MLQTIRRQNLRLKNSSIKNSSSRCTSYVHHNNLIITTFVTRLTNVTAGHSPKHHFTHCNYIYIYICLYSIHSFIICSWYLHLHHTFLLDRNNVTNDTTIHLGILYLLLSFPFPFLYHHHYHSLTLTLTITITITLVVPSLILLTTIYIYIYIYRKKRQQNNNVCRLNNGSLVILDPSPQGRLCHSNYKVNDDTYPLMVMIIEVPNRG